MSLQPLKFQNLLFFLPILLFQWACIGDKQPGTADNNSVESKKRILKNDLTIDNGLLLKDFEYVLKVDKLDFTIEVALKRDSTIAIKFNFYQTLSFAENWEYQMEVMDEIAKDFQPQDFRSVHLGRLIYTGDLCLEASEEVLAANWDGSDYPRLKNILDSGAIVKSYASFFEKYQVDVSGISFEKAFLTESSIINQYSKIERKNEDYPPKILDAITWVILN